MALQPVGPLPASTYWRRRVLFAVVAVVALLLLAKACTGGGDSDKDTLAAPSPTASPSASASTTPTPTASSEPSLTQSPSAAAPAACGDAALKVTAESDATSYRMGAAPRFTLTVTNTGKVACRRALGPDEVELRVFSGEDRIWSSDDCAKATGKGILLLAAGESRAMTVQWPGKRTKPGCDTGAVAQPGTYRVSARVGDIVRQGSVFRVTA
jgi:hypothetical protein